MPSLPSLVANFYPRPPRGGRLTDATSCKVSCEISIHALREEGDTNGLVAFANGYIFLSTPSARRATCSALGMMCDILISIHALREEGDWIFDGLKCTLKRFLSTPSARRATGQQ